MIEAYGVGAPILGVRRRSSSSVPRARSAFADRKLIGATFVPADKLVPILAEARSDPVVRERPAESPGR